MYFYHVFPHYLYFDCSSLGSSLCGIFQTRILGELPFPTPGDCPYPGIKPVSFVSPTLAGRFFTASATWEAQLYYSYALRTGGSYI